MEKNYLIKSRTLLAVTGLQSLAVCSAMAEDVNVEHSLTADGHYLDASGDSGFDWNLLYQVSGQHAVSDRLTLDIGAFAATTNSPSATLNDAQGFSNIETGDPLGLTALHLNYQLNGVRIMAGAFDENSEFAGVDTASQFLNSSMGYSPTLTNFISYPEAATGLVIESRTSDTTSVKLGYLTRDLKFDARNHHGNAQFEWRPNEAHRFALGISDGHWYGLGEITLGQTDNWQWNSFVQWGENDSESEIGRHLGAGVVLNQRAEGFSLGLARTDIESSITPDEQVWELYARWAVSDSVVLQPDVQLIERGASPNGMSAPDDSVAITLRMVLNW